MSITDAGVYVQSSQAAVAVGSTYVDPVFGETIRRVSTDWATSDCYGRNGFWNSDGTYTVSGNSLVIDTTTGASVRSFSLDWPFYTSFSPVDPNIIYYRSGAQLRSFDVSDGSSSLVKTFPATLNHLGGSQDFIDASGRYFLVNYSSQTRVWDSQTDTVYSGGITRGGGGGWTAISTDANWVIVASGYHYSYPIDHGSQSVGSETLYWTLCGDHADAITASDGNTYGVVPDCDFSPGDIWRADVTIAQTAGNVAKQKSDNVRIVEHPGLPALDVHTSAATTGTDWVWLELTTPGTVGGGVQPYRNEILRVNVITGLVERIAHHRSNYSAGYYAQPRVQATWDGTKCLWACDGNGFTGGGGGLYVAEMEAEVSTLPVLRRRMESNE